MAGRILETADPEQPQCEQCGEAPAAVSLETAGLCDDCAADTARSALEEAGFGRCCCAIINPASGFMAVCLAPFGEEHSH